MGATSTTGMDSVTLPSAWQKCKFWQKSKFIIQEVKEPSKHQLLAGGLLSLLTSSFAPFGQSGRVTHATVIGECVRDPLSVMEEEKEDKDRNRPILGVRILCVTLSQV